MLSTVIGPQYDIIGFDPRGIGATTPAAQCFDTESQYQIWGLQQGRILNISDYSTVTYAQARTRLVAERCQGILGGKGKEEINGTAEEWGPARFMSSMSVAADVVEITEALGQDKINWWGFVSADESLLDTTGTFTDTPRRATVQSSASTLPHYIPTRLGAL